MLQKINQINFAKQSIGTFPTPIYHLPRLSDYLDGPNIYIKRDDLTGLALGGNKTRKLEYILGDAINQGADTLITAGASQSNHCRQTAAAAAKLGLECHLILGGKKPQNPNGNLLLNQLLGSHIHFTGDNRKGEDIPNLFKQLTKQGKKPYIVPYGGSNELGALAYVEAMIELQQQMNKLPIDNFSHIIFASSSGGTQAGLIVGQLLIRQQMEHNTHIIGIKIDKEQNGPLPFDQQIQALANTTAKKVRLGKAIGNTDIRLNRDYTGDGYGILSHIERNAIKLCAELEGILLDPVYTGRAMGGLIDMINLGKFDNNDNVLFWHTGGSPALFAYADQLI